MERQLATIQQVRETQPLEWADKLCLATILGWKVIVPKEIKTGDTIIYFECDSVLPDGAKWCEFLRKRGFRIKTMKMRGTYSQGLALPIKEVFPDRSEALPLGTNVTEILNVTKYEPPESGATGFKGFRSSKPWPQFLPKTDEIRLQSVPGVLDEIQDLPFFATIKLDGTSSTFYRYQGKFGVCSRNLERPSPELETDLYWEIAEKYKLWKILPEGFAVQGEINGPGIQKNRVRKEKVELNVFDVWNITEARYLNMQEMIDFCNKYSLEMVPFYGSFSPDDSGPKFVHTIEAWEEQVEGNYPNCDHPREGLVIRPQQVTYSPTLKGRLSFKIINKDFLLKTDS